MIDYQLIHIKEPLYCLVNIIYEPRLLIKNMVNCILNYNQCAKGATIIAIMMFLKMIFCL